MIAELRTDELVTYTVEKRVVKEGDDMAQYKSQRDRQRLRNWLGALLKEHDVVIFYTDEDDGLEKFVIGTTKNYNVEAIEIPVVKESWLGEIEDTYHHIPFISMPDRVPYYIHADDVTRFIVKNDKINEISKKTKLF